MRSTSQPTPAPTSPLTGQPATQDDPPVSGPRDGTKPALRYRGLAAALLLLVGALGVYAPRLTPLLRGQAAPDDPSLTYIADLDYWQRTDREMAVQATARFDLDSDLTNVPLVVGDWKGEEVPETNQEVMILLDPEQYVQRLYFNSKGQHIWLSMIGGRSSQPFHAPDICYDADGWQYNLSSASIPLEGGGEIHGLWMEAHKRLPGAETDTEHIVFYFYLFPDRARTLQDGIVLFKLTSARYGTKEETLAVHADFVRQFFQSARRPS
ncbi:MAG TPA: exosortase-associated EpsI family protein [Caldilineaceae bacterium]|nr:exosortase-associated EpsI family protein [Caldilineaceae bacterium]